ncbi:MAG: HDIG domain-containing protein [Nitrospirae bacterium]|nr:HDIG domain-containing protein [Nitrospirota bacterium]
MEKEKENKSGPLYQDPVYQGYALGAVVVLIAVYLLAPYLLFYSPELTIGEIVSRDIKAPTNLELVDSNATQRAQRLAEGAVPVVYDLDLEAVQALDEKAARAFQSARDLPVRAEPSRQKRTGSAADQEFQQKLGIRLSSATLSFFQGVGHGEEFENRARQFLRSAMSHGIISDRTFAAGEKERGIVIRTVGERQEQFVKNAQSIPNLKEAQAAARESASQAFPEDPTQASGIGELVSKLLIPNVTLNKSETESRQHAARASVKPLYYKVKKGERLFRAGERVAHEDRPILQELSKYQQKGFVARILVGLAILVTAVLAILYLDIRRYRAPLTRDLPKLLLLGILLVGTIAVSKFSYFLMTAFADQFPSIDPASSIYAIPVTVGAMLITLLFDTHLGLIFSFVMSLLMGIGMPEAPAYALYAFVGSVVAVFSVITCHRRTQLIRAGLAVSVVNVILVSAINLFEASPLNMKTVFDLLFGAGGGLLSGLIVSGFLPALESLFTISTDIRLLELLDLNHPLLRRLSVQAPGTYYHSMMVSNLAEAATEAVGENPLLARVCCYYHDIGKMLKPDYYIENQMGSANRHDKLSPQLSSLVLAAHVKEGMDLAREYKLPQAIIDIIPQHHGTRLMSYFYNRAQKGRAPDQPPVNEADFRYPGPTPQTKIAAIIMMADAVEAASRVLDNPTPARIAALVEKLATTIYLDGQLSESDLTLKDLKTIQRSFVKVLTGQFHQRIEYPGMGLPDYGASEYDDSDREPAAPHSPAARTLQNVGRKGSSQAGAV